MDKWGIGQQVTPPYTPQENRTVKNDDSAKRGGTDKRPCTRTDAGI